jgi:hypothetical protein
MKGGCLPQHQGGWGLGLEAQREAIAQFCQRSASTPAACIARVAGVLSSGGIDRGGAYAQPR